LSEAVLALEGERPMEETTRSTSGGGILMSGYTAGSIAWVDLTSGEVRTEALQEHVVRKYLGGKGLGAYLLYRHLKPHTDPYASENLLIFDTGPLTGTTFPCSGRGAVITRSPMTGTFLDSYAGGTFGPMLRYAGYGALVITGKAEKPVYIVVDNGTISLREAGKLWGLTTTDAEGLLRYSLKEKDGVRVSIATVGPAGEKLVRCANIVTEGRAFGRGGAGAVMGSKNLKAVALRGTNKVAIADEAAFKEVVGRARKKIAEHPMTKKNGIFPRMGTLMTVDLTQVTGTLPTKNWTENTFDRAEDINGNAFVKNTIKSRACYMCPIACSRVAKTTAFGVETVNEGPEYETVFSFGSNCEIGDPAVINAADKLCEEYGMDTITCGSAVGFAMECFEKGLITKQDAGGLELTFGNGEAVIALVHLIGKKEGLGAVLSEGVRIASTKIKGSADFAIHVKGLELPGYDPRGMKGQGLTYALADRGACHVRSNTIRTELLGLPEKVDRYGYDGKAKMISELQLTYVMFDVLISCAFAGFAITPEDYVDAVSAVTGWPFSLEELRTVTQRTWNLTRLFNSREGFGRKDDTLPRRLFDEASTKGPSSSQVVDRKAFEKMLDEYYEAVGWDSATGIPTKKRLEELGIEGW
jgi:aldehyde:ferredoxin oxidoreductase